MSMIENNLDFYNAFKVSSGFNIPEHHFVYLDTISISEIKNTLKYYDSYYSNTDNIINKGDILSSNDKLKIFWKITEDNNIIIYKDLIRQLSLYYADTTTVITEETENNITELVKAFSLADFIIEKVFYKIEGNWLLKQRNEYKQGIVELFLYWFASGLLKYDNDGLNCLKFFIDNYAKDIHLYDLNKFEDVEIMSAFIQSFFNFRNDTKYFYNLLNLKSK